MRRRDKNRMPVYCPICKKKIVFYAAGTDIAGDAKIYALCKRCGEVIIDTAYIKKALPSQRVVVI